MKYNIFGVNVGNDQYGFDEADVLGLEILIGNIYIWCGYGDFRQIVGIPMWTNCVPLLANLFYHGYHFLKYITLIKIFLKNIGRLFQLTYLFTQRN